MFTGQFVESRPGKGVQQTIIHIPFSGAPQYCDQQTCGETDSSSSGYSADYACVLYSTNGTVSRLSRCGAIPIVSIPNISDTGNTVLLNGAKERIEIPFQFQDQTPSGNQLSGLSMSLRGNLVSSRTKIAAVYLEMAHELSFTTYFLLGATMITRYDEQTQTCPDCWRQYNITFSKASETIALYRTGGRNNFLLVFSDELFNGPEVIINVEQNSLSWSNASAPSLCDPTRAASSKAAHRDDVKDDHDDDDNDNDDENSDDQLSHYYPLTSPSGLQLQRRPSSRQCSKEQPQAIQALFFPPIEEPSAESSEYCLSFIDIIVETRELDHSSTSSFLITVLATILGVTSLVLLILVGLWIVWIRRRSRESRRSVNRRDEDEQQQPLLQTRKDVVNFQDIEIFEKIGRGSFGDVFRGSWAGTIVALKVLPSAMHFSPEILLEFKKEITLMTTLRHPNIVQFLAANTMPPDVFVILEYMSRGSLASILHEPSIELSPQLLCRLLLDAARGMHYLHSSVPPIIHRDLKSANLLVDDVWRLKVADFGLARIFSKTGETMTMVGSASWTAPELLNHQHATEKVDIYSFAIVVWECLTRETPHRDLTAFQILIQVSQHGLRPPVPSDAPLRLVDLMKACWAENPRERPSFSYILRQLSSIVSSFDDQPATTAAQQHLSEGAFVPSALYSSTSSNRSDDPDSDQD